MEHSGNVTSHIFVNFVYTSSYLQAKEDKKKETEF